MTCARLEVLWRLKSWTWKRTTVNATGVANGSEVCRKIPCALTAIPMMYRGCDSPGFRFFAVTFFNT